MAPPEAAFYRLGKYRVNLAGRRVFNGGGQLEQYRSRGQCLEVCKRLPEGAPGDEQVNTV